MKGQTEIQPGTPKVLGIDSQYSGLLNVEIPLEPHPDRYWAEIFNNGPSGVSFSISMHPPRVVGGVVEIRPPDNEVDRYVAHVKERIEGTNRNYAERVEPKLRAAQEAEEREEADRKRRIEEAQKRVQGSVNVGIRLRVKPKDSKRSATESPGIDWRTASSWCRFTMMRGTCSTSEAGTIRWR